MHANRPLAALASLLFVAQPANAQATQEPGAAPRRIETPVGEATVLHERADAEPARFTLWAAYPGDRGHFLDHAQYLADLQSRWQAQGVAVAVLLPREAAARVAEQKPSLLVAAADAPHAGIGGCYTFVSRASGEPLFGWQGLDGAVDLLASQIDGKLELAVHQLQGQLESLLVGVADGGDYESEVAQCLKALPHSGRARAAAVLYHWWSRGDLAAARQALDDGLAALANEAVPMCIFVDLVLRGDRNDPGIARALAVAMGPVAATAPEGDFTQLVHLRALLRAGQDRLAGRIAAKLPKRLKGRAEQQLVFAETLMDGLTPAAHRDLAEQAIADAEVAGGFERWAFCARHKLLVRCGEVEAAVKLMADYRESAAGRGDLNNDAWYLMVRPETMGRFDTLALAQAKALQEQPGAQLSSNNKDTVALAYFVNGQVDQAVELQTEAVNGANATPIFGFRLARYRATQKQLADANRTDKAGKPK